MGKETVWKGATIDFIDLCLVLKNEFLRKTLSFLQSNSQIGQFCYLHVKGFKGQKAALSFTLSECVKRFLIENLEEAEDL